MTALSADRPSSNPQDDLFGHAPFAESLANAFADIPAMMGWCWRSMARGAQESPRY